MGDTEAEPAEPAHRVGLSTDQRERDRLVLSRKQERRLIACRHAREILAPRTFASSGGVSPGEVIHLAGFIITGEVE